MRYDYILIWGNGLVHRKEILNEIRNNGNFKIEKILFHNPKNVKKLVKKIYSFDYAPFWHLKSKTKYLLSTKPEVLFIFIKNIDPQEEYVGEGDFRHIESRTIRKLKDSIRDQFNERKEDRRTEDHVIHGSDNEDQVDYILRYLGFPQGLAYLKKIPNPILDARYYLENFHNFELKEVDIETVFCNILTGTKNKPMTKITPLGNSPQYACLEGNSGTYAGYLEEFSGRSLTEDYTPEGFLNLSRNFSYLDSSHPTDYIITKRYSIDKYVILDGVHRASIEKYQGKKKIIIAVIS